MNDQQDEYELSVPSNINTLSQPFASRLARIIKQAAEDRQEKKEEAQLSESLTRRARRFVRWRVFLFGIILPYNWSYIIWSDILLLFALYSCVITPFEFSFYYGHPNFPVWLTVFDTFCGLLFAVDVFINFRLAFKDPIHYTMVTDRRSIARRYLKSFFLLDLLACLPWDILYRFTNGLLVFSSLMWFRLVRMRHIKGWFQRVGKDIRFNFYVVRISEMLLTEYLVLHISACLFYFLAVSYPEGPNTWIGSLTLGDKSYAHFKTMPLAELYCVSLYWAMITMASVGYGDIHPVNPREMLFAIVYITWDMIFTAYLVANFTALVVQAQHKGSPAFRDRMDNVIRYCKRTQLPYKLQLQLINQVVLRFERSHEDDQLLMEMFPQSIRDAVAVAKHGPVIDHAYLFRGCSRPFQEKLATLLRAEYFMPNEMVVTTTDLAENMYLVLTGTVEVHVRSASSSLSETRQPGDPFGEADVLTWDMGHGHLPPFLHFQLPYTARTLTVCELLRLERDSFASLLHAHPEDAKRVMANFLQHSSLDKSASLDADSDPPPPDNSLVEPASPSSISSSSSSTSSSVPHVAPFPHSATYSSVVTDRVAAHWEDRQAQLGMAIIHVASRGDVPHMRQLLEQAGRRWEATTSARDEGGGEGPGGEGGGGVGTSGSQRSGSSSSLHEAELGEGVQRSLRERRAEGSGRNLGLVSALARLPFIASPTSSISTLPPSPQSPLSPSNLRSASAQPVLPFICTIVDFNGRSPLHLAASRGFVEMCALLLLEGSDVNLKDSHGVTPLLDALREGNRITAALLREHGAEVLLDDPAKEMCVAVVQGRLEYVQRLLLFGVDPDVRNALGRTPLHVAASEGSLALVRLLLAHGADPLAADAHGALPLDEALNCGSRQVVALLQAWEEQEDNGRGKWGLHGEAEAEEQEEGVIEGAEQWKGGHRSGWEGAARLAALTPSTSHPVGPTQHRNSCTMHSAAPSVPSAPDADSPSPLVSPLQHSSKHVGPRYPSISALFSYLHPSEVESPPSASPLNRPGEHAGHRDTVPPLDSPALHTSSPSQTRSSHSGAPPFQPAATAASKLTSVSEVSVPSVAAATAVSSSTSQKVPAAASPSFPTVSSMRGAALSDRQRQLCLPHFTPRASASSSTIRRTSSSSSRSSSERSTRPLLRTSSSRSGKEWGM